MSNEIDLSHSDFGVVSQYGLTLEEFSKIVADLNKKSAFKFELKPSLFDSVDPPGKVHMPHCYVSFIYYCNALDKVGVDIANLLKEFIDAQSDKKVGGVRHTSSLARLGFILHSNEYNVIFPNKNTKQGEKNPDLIVDDITAELKVPLSDFLKQTEGGHSPKIPNIKEGAVSITETVKETVSNWIRNNEGKALKQAEMIFVDFTDHSYFGALQLSSDYVESIPEPVKGKVIVYQTTHYMPDVQITFKGVKGKEVLFTPKAPHLDYFWGVYKEDIIEIKDSP